MPQKHRMKYLKSTEWDASKAPSGMLQKHRTYRALHKVLFTLVKTRGGDRGFEVKNGNASRESLV